jgi:hypothetical protein
LGFPVIDINVDDDQLEDRIDDALQQFRNYHYDGTVEEYLAVKVTQSIPASERQRFRTGTLTVMPIKLYEGGGRWTTVGYEGNTIKLSIGLTLYVSSLKCESLYCPDSRSFRISSFDLRFFSLIVPTESISF